MTEADRELDELGRAKTKRRRVMNYVYYSPEFDELCVMSRNYGSIFFWFRDAFIESPPHQKTPLYFIFKDHLGFC